VHLNLSIARVSIFTLRKYIEKKKKVYLNMFVLVTMKYGIHGLNNAGK
jgi:hypothetical protein